MKNFFLIFFILFSIKLQAKTDSTVQVKRDFMDVWRGWRGKEAFTLFEQNKRDTSKFHLSIVPSFGTSASGKGLVTSVVSAFYLGDRKNTNLSTVYFTPYFTLSEQYVLPLRFNIWTKKNQFNFTGDYRFMKYPQDQYNIYDPNEETLQFRLNYLQTRLYQTVSKGIYPNFALGMGYQFDAYSNIFKDNIQKTGTLAYDQYGDSSLTSYNTGNATFEFVYDDRRNTVDPLKGNYVRVSLLQNVFFSRKRADWSSIYIDARKYIPVSKNRNQVLAIWGLYWSMLSGRANYLDLPSNGWDNYGKTARGLYRNRYRSTGLIYLETEYRTAITQNGLWGMVVFCNFTSPAIIDKQQFQTPHFAAGTGLRLKLNKNIGTKVGVDFAFSKSYNSIYLTLNEYF